MRYPAPRTSTADDGCSRSQVLRWTVGLCLLVVLVVNFSLIAFVSDGVGSGGLLSLVGSGAAFFTSDPAKRTNVFSGQLTNLQIPDACLAIPTTAAPIAAGSAAVGLEKYAPIARRCDASDQALETVAVAAREPIQLSGTSDAIGSNGNGGNQEVFLRHIESLRSNLKSCLTGQLASGADVAQLVSVDCAAVPAQWLFSKTKQVILFDRAATPHLSDFRHVNGDVQDQSTKTSPLQCLTLSPTPSLLTQGSKPENIFDVVLRPCLSLGDENVGLQQWEFYANRQTPSLLHTRAYARYDFNEFRSREIGQVRTAGWPNTRSRQCGVSTSDGKHGLVLEPTSVIICFVNEEWFALWRTINSVIDLSPPELLREIVLVDDGSDATDMHEPLERAIAAHPAYHLLKLYRTGGRTGLIRARLFGAERAEASILTFLDSHIEVNEGWLEPLLARVSEDATRVVAPVITVINQDTLANQAATSITNVAYGVLDWNLIFHWSYSKSRPPPQVKSKHLASTDAVEAPTMAGGLFSIDRDFFYSIGSYDDGMTGWGGENIEISFRIWTCGGSIEVAPCSIVGHIFRQRNPSPFPGANINSIFRHNLIRAAEVWMDDFKQIYYKTAGVRTPISAHDGFDSKLVERIEMRKNLQCKDFQWYLDTVYPSLFAPLDEFVVYHGSLFQGAQVLGMEEDNASSESSINFCLRAASPDPNVGSNLQLKPCAGKPEEKFYYGQAGQLVLSGWPGMTLCVTAGPTGALSSSRSVVLNVCSGHRQNTLAASQKWTAHRTAADNGDIVWFSNEATELCLGVADGGPLKVNT
eukprot:INCI5058.19.p1 GENE.INCI5058.19~~INCI5058.19.p1  ORF type:complete len:810 (+),score=125.08 INCI5058.19:172-2601(+)